jgi:RimJ/RimL family protein N-acetyltransferase
MGKAMLLDVSLRELATSDLPIFFAQQRDPEANQMAAYIARDPSDHEAFMAHWAKIRCDPTVMHRTILVAGEVAGNIASFVMEGEREVGYWLGKAYWGKGIATAALAQFLTIETTRPLYAHVAQDNIGSRRALEKCGFTIAGVDKEYSRARDTDVPSYVLTLV